jgi:predicted transglutaminase-like cysteine proteinase
MGTKTWLGAVVGTAALLACAAPAAAQAFMTTSGLSTQPVGHYDFCRRHADECGPTRMFQPIELTRELWSLVVEINNRVNASIIPRTDMEMWGVEEYWSYPVHGVGDCEDFVLEKRRLLAKAGIPLSNLLMTVVRQPNGDGHAVLTIATSMGDFVLDNLEPRVLAWRETDYRFLKRQSARHAGMWVGIDDGRDVLVGSVGAH